MKVLKRLSFIILFPVLCLYDLAVFVATGNFSKPARRFYDWLLDIDDA